MSGGGEWNKSSLSPSPKNDRKNTHEIHKLKHYQQKYHWDCGLSCCLMVMSDYDRDFVLSNLTKFVEEEGFGDSTWTIDLCYILRRFKINFIYTTITIGVDPGYSKESFYDKVLAKDCNRVDTRFKSAEENKIVILEKSVGLEEIVDHLEKTGPVIILTNANLLHCSRCSNLSSCYQFCFSSSLSYQEPSWITVFKSFLVYLLQIIKKLLDLLFYPLVHLNLGIKLKNRYQCSYQGHYVVLVGVDTETKEILYRNPTLKDHICYMSFSSLEEARTSYGTDEDLIFVQP